MKIPARLRGVVVALLLLPIGLLSGCSSFPRHWRAASAGPQPADDISGAWTGSWRSEVNGHTGSLQCLVTRVDAAHYRARYRASYRKFLRFGYTVPMEVTRSEGGAISFRGEANLGWWTGGVYHYDGRATATNYISTYSSKYDHGTFEMTRPGRK